MHCNTRGDVEYIYYNSGTLLAKYTYDSWGKLLSVKNASGNAITNPAHIGNLNPIRYRGYYYDSETGLYYLQSRYYDPVVGRFLNADAYADTGTGVLGTNVFAYCLNNPVNNSDILGFAPTKANFTFQILCNREFLLQSIVAKLRMQLYFTGSSGSIKAVNDNFTSSINNNCNVVIIAVHGCETSIGDLNSEKLNKIKRGKMKCLMLISCNTFDTSNVKRENTIAYKLCKKLKIPVLCCDDMVGFTIMGTAGPKYSNSDGWHVLSYSDNQVKCEVLGNMYKSIPLLLNLLIVKKFVSF